MTSVNFLRLPSHGRLAAWRARPSHPAAGRQGRAAASRSSRPAAAQRATEVLAHDLNNLLAVILAANEVLALDLPVGSYNHELAQVGQGAAERAALLLARWPGRSGPRRPVGIASDAGEAIRLTARLVRLSATDAVRIQCDINERNTACVADRLALESALLNLCLNACHAMPQGGVLTLSADITGPDVVIRVSDTGCGMSPEVLARATEPGFTTRSNCGGTGLGLASVEDFARRWGGHLELASRVGRGATVTLRLPRAPDGDAPPPPATP